MAESRKPVGAADPPGGRQTPTKPIAYDGPHLFRLRRGVATLLAAPADTAIADGNRPVIEEIAADRHFVAAVVVLPGVMGFESDGEQIVHKRFPFKRSWRPMASCHA